MRLIDADAMMAGFAEIVNEEHFTFMTTGQVMEMIDIQPTIEKKHGHWIVKNHPLGGGGEFVCSECGSIDRDIGIPKFCRICGAKMDESEVEE